MEFFFGERCFNWFKELRDCFERVLTEKRKNSTWRRSAHYGTETPQSLKLQMNSELSCLRLGACLKLPLWHVAVTTRRQSSVVLMISNVAAPERSGSEVDPMCRARSVFTLKLSQTFVSWQINFVQREKFDGTRQRKTLNATLKAENEWKSFKILIRFSFEGSVRAKRANN